VSGQTTWGAVRREAGAVAVVPGSAQPAAEQIPLPRPRYLSPEALFTAQSESLVRALTFACGDYELAEDSVQEAFARLLTHWDRIAGYDDPTAWVRRVALNLAQDHRRFLLRRARLLTRLRPRPQAFSYSITGDPALWSAVRELPARQRTALSLFYLGDLSVAEVAGAMGVGEGTVKGYLDRARERLRRKLETRHEL
jgi:RNA polymerase sigma-70 factor, ECF subfamily